jgi:hypothetical protein
MIELTPEFVEKYATAPKRERRELCLNLTCSQKMEIGPLLFERECRIIKAEILRQMPHASDAFIRDVLRMTVRKIHGDD